MRSPSWRRTPSASSSSLDPLRQYLAQSWATRGFERSAEIAGPRSYCLPRGVGSGASCRCRRLLVSARGMYSVPYFGSKRCCALRIHYCSALPSRLPGCLADSDRQRPVLARLRHRPTDSGPSLARPRSSGYAAAEVTILRPYL